MFIEWHVVIGPSLAIESSTQNTMTFSITTAKAQHHV